MTRQKMHAAIDGIVAAAHADHPENRPKVEQLEAHAQTLHMLVDDLFDTVPYTPIP